MKNKDFDLIKEYISYCSVSEKQFLINLGLHDLPLERLLEHKEGYVWVMCLMCKYQRYKLAKKLDKKFPFRDERILNYAELYCPKLFKYFEKNERRSNHLK